MKSQRHLSLLSLFDGDVNIQELKNLCIEGCPDTLGIRSKAWKYLLNYLPTTCSKQVERLRFCRNQYEAYVKEFVVESCCGASLMTDHPLNSEPNGDWIAFFQDNEVLLQINKDCRRLCPDLDFFHRPTDYPSIKLFGGEVPIGVLRRRVETSSFQAKSLNRNLVGTANMIQLPNFDPYQPTNYLSSGLEYDQSHRSSRSCSSHKQPSKLSESSSIPDEEPHWEVIERILFVYYKTHSSQRYIQGMNEIIAPIYYVFATDPSDEWKEFAEADTFFCFNNLMAEIQHNFVQKLDGSQVAGIGGQMKMVTDLLARFDPTLLSHLSRIALIPEHFAFRWLSLLFAQEFPLPDVLQIWDTLFSDPYRFHLLPYVCCSMLMHLRKQLLEADFSTAVQLVQNYPTTINLQAILIKARSLYTQ